ncbi:VOC family protein [Agaribacter flavus]|uniref:VOC family protein n=1 Tax=Agaribacter flavus TaxID=1902781 RepID=A0ABV7FLG1_9ALTE
MQYLSAVSILVEEYDSVISWFTRCLNFEVLVDQVVTEDMRFVRLAPSKDASLSIVLNRVTGENAKYIGKQAGDDVLMFLNTDDFDASYQDMLQQGVEFCEAPRNEVYAKVVVFKDCLGNKWDLLEPTGLN